MFTGKSLSEVFILTSTNPQYDKRLCVSRSNNKCFWKRFTCTELVIQWTICCHIVGQLMQECALLKKIYLYWMSPQIFKPSIGSALRQFDCLVRRFLYIVTGRWTPWSQITVLKSLKFFLAELSTEGVTDKPCHKQELKSFLSMIG